MAVACHQFVLLGESQIAEGGSHREGRIQSRAPRLTVGHGFQFALNEQSGAAVDFGHVSHLCGVEQRILQHLLLTIDWLFARYQS